MGTLRVRSRDETGTFAERPEDETGTFTGRTTDNCGTFMKTLWGPIANVRYSVSLACSPDAYPLRSLNANSSLAQRNPVLQCAIIPANQRRGGCGRRKPIVIPPEAEGYSAKNFKSVSSGGKTIFYVVPLQDSLDTSPLAPDSPHFSKMPKTTCYQCSEVMLAVHIKTCIGKLSSDDDREDQISDVWVVEDKSKVACPICYSEFLKDDITIHARVSVERESSVATCADEGFPVHTSACTPKSLEDVLTFLKEQVDTTKEFKLCVDREDLPERGIIEWKRKKTASPASLLKVVYIGESGIDTGALRKEFLTGEVTFSCLSKEDVMDLESYLLICRGSSLKFRVEDAADTESLMMLADDIVSCGYTSQIKHELKESIIRSIVLHSTTRLIPILQQLKNGLQLYGLVDQLNKNSEPDADFIMMNCQPRYSEKGTSKEASERKVTNFLQDFLQELEVAERDASIADEEGDGVLGETRPLSVPMVLQWMTGQSHIPILPDERRRFKITCNFDHDCME
ncbi:G2 M phase-specific E3 ubiquitin- ligase-like isoform X1 [Labeo rohita]|uniref:G2 M phase-specific E3 ubiquitin-ligase-like isoform X1 n=1 Tax=Labeo rohita TaxID=84645 RepID=A0A498NUQ5_LABRO|nr:G2 M phase-specific E3 ubiquitin- ligase-like isoform X1 [Labeo rohita]